VAPLRAVRACIGRDSVDKVLGSFAEATEGLDNKGHKCSHLGECLSGVFARLLGGFGLGSCKAHLAGPIALKMVEASRMCDFNVDQIALRADECHDISPSVVSLVVVCTWFQKSSTPHLVYPVSEHMQNSVVATCRFGISVVGESVPGVRLLVASAVIDVRHIWSKGLAKAKVTSSSEGHRIHAYLSEWVAEPGAGTPCSARA
jgi:hypothetical protein